MDTISLKFPRKCCFNLPESLNPLQCLSEWITQGDFQITGICTPDLSYFVYILSHHLLYSDILYFVRLHKHEGLALDSLLGVAWDTLFFLSLLLSLGTCRQHLILKKEMESEKHSEYQEWIGPDKAVCD